MTRGHLVRSILTRLCPPDNVSGCQKGTISEVLSLCNQTHAETFSEGLRQLENELDYVQEVLVNSGHYTELNPLLHAVLDEFGRRSRHKRFQPDKKISEKDSDLKSEELRKNSVSWRSSARKVNTRWRSNRARTRRTGLCYAFQRGTCNLKLSLLTFMYELRRRTR